MFKLKYINLMCLMLSSIATCGTYAATLQHMSDEQMSEMTGQALMSLSYIAPNDAVNLESSRVGGDKGVGFYKLGLEAELELNMNIKKLQLGCGGSNGAGACDIDIDNMSLSGGSGGVQLNTDGSVKLDANGNSIPLTDRNSRAGSSAKLTNPFIEFAIKNPNSASTREIVGLRLSAEGVKGLMTMGDENGTTSNGINVLSGYMNVQSNPGVSAITGKLNTKPGFLDAEWFSKNRTSITGKKYSDGTNIEPLNGSMNLDINLGKTQVDFEVTKGGFWIPGVKDVPFYASLSTLRGVRVDNSLTETQGNINGNRIKALQVVPNQVNLPNAVLGFNTDDPRGKEFNDRACGSAFVATGCNNFGVSNGFIGPEAYKYKYNQSSGIYEYIGTDTSASAFQSFGTCSGTAAECDKSNPNSKYYLPGGTILKTQGGATLYSDGAVHTGSLNNAVSATVTGCRGAGGIGVVGCILAPSSLDYIKMFGKVTGLFANVTFEQSLGMVHSLSIDSPLYLGLQQQALQWPGAKSDDIAQKGWWMSLADPVYLGDLLPSQPVDLCPGGMGGALNTCAYPQFVIQANKYFKSNVAGGGDLDAALNNKQSNPIGAEISGTSGLNLPDGFKLTLRDIQLATQNFAPNCYGNLKFC